MTGAWSAWRLVARDGIKKLLREDASVPRGLDHSQRTLWSSYRILSS